jgi:hypothetical protein
VAQRGFAAELILLMWGRLATCGGLVIRLLLCKKIVEADYQPALQKRFR